MQIKNKLSGWPAAFLVIVCALALGIYYAWPALTNPYAIDGDVRTHIDWMRQFRDPSLFPNDFLMTYARYRQPWGLILLYYPVSFFFDPVFFSKILSLILLAMGSYYAFKLGEYKGSRSTGLLAAILFMTNPNFFVQMAGGLGRSFGYPLMMAFLYYLIKKDGLKAALIMVLGCLFYPVIFFLSFFTYLFSFVKIQDHRFMLDLHPSKWKGFALGVAVGIALLAAQHVLLVHPALGPLMTKKQMLNQPEFYKHGRLAILPVSPLSKTVIRMAPEGVIKVGIEKNFVSAALIAMLKIVFWLAVLAAGFAGLKRTLFYPSELLALFLAGILMYQLADLFLLKFYLPERYLRYSLHLIGLFLFAFFIPYLVQKIKTFRIRSAFYGGLLFIFFFLNLGTPTEWSFTNHLKYKLLYASLAQLPKEVMIAAHPKLADGIPTFAKRKVLIKYELSSPLYSNFWREVKKRTYAFFDAYYAEDLASINQFCETYHVDYLVVDQEHFTEKFLVNKTIYFEPFNAYMKNKIGKRRRFALMQIPEKEKLFTHGSVFVIHKNSLKPQARRV